MLVYLYICIYIYIYIYIYAYAYMYIYVCTYGWERDRVKKFVQLVGPREHGSSQETRTGTPKVNFKQDLNQDPLVVHQK